jgi:xanthine dehydrogenase accessory factor
MTRPLKQVLIDLKEALGAGQHPQVTAEELPCFSAKALEGNAHVSPEYLDVILASLGPEDIATIDFALEALESDLPAWLGFKIVTDPALAVDSVDTAVVGIEGKGEGSADAIPGLFVATEDKQIVFSRAYSKRDTFQMLDITRGPHMHNEQYAGVAWLSLPLKREGIVYVFGAGEIAHYIERMAQDCDFETVVIDYDSTYLNEDRLPLSRLVLLDSFTAIPDLGITAADYVLVLSRGHMYDPEILLHGLNAGAHYVGMMGCSDKNERVLAMTAEQGITTEQLAVIHAPIGLKFGAKTPAELALCIVAELVKVRHEARKV